MKETELPVSHKRGDDVAEESRVSEPWEAPSEAAILLKIESLDSGLTVLSRPGKGPSHTSETTSMPSREDGLWTGSTSDPVRTHRWPSVLCRSELCS